MKPILFFLLVSLLILGVNAQDIRVMSYNIKYDNTSDTINNWNDRKDKLVAQITHYKPSFIGVQEALAHQLHYIDSSLIGYNYIGVGREDGKQKGEFAEIHYDATRYSLIKNNTFWLSDSPEEISVGWDAALERICTYGLFKDNTTGLQFWVFNTHFDHKGNMARSQSADLIISKIKKLNTDNLPVILTGDFNLSPEQKPIERLSTFLVDSKRITKTPFYGPSGTFNNFDQSQILDHRIDYIFSKKFDVISYQHIDDRQENQKFISDHFPVLAVFSVSK